MTTPPATYLEIPNWVARQIIAENKLHDKFIHDGWGAPASPHSNTSLVRTYYAAPWCWKFVELYQADRSFPLFASIDLVLDDPELASAIDPALRLGAIRELVDSLLIAGADAADRLGADDDDVRHALMRRET